MLPGTLHGQASSLRRMRAITVIVVTASAVVGRAPKPVVLVHALVLHIAVGAVVVAVH